jgi:hypothetical protein
MTQTLAALPTNEIPTGSVDFVKATVTDLNGNTLTVGVEIAITRAADPDAVHTWLPATWLGTAAAERECQTTRPVDTAVLDGVPGDGTRYGVYVRLDNSPAHPILQVGWIVLTD